MWVTILRGQVADFAWYMLRYSDHVDGRTLTFHKHPQHEEFDADNVNRKLHPEIGQANRPFCASQLPTQNRTAARLFPKTPRKIRDTHLVNHPRPSLRKIRGLTYLEPADPGV